MKWLHIFIIFAVLLVYGIPNSLSQEPAAEDAVGRKFVIDSTITTNYTGSGLDILSYETNAFTYYQGGSLWWNNMLDSSGKVVKQYSKRETYNADSSAVETLVLRTPELSGIYIDGPPFDSTFTSAIITPRNGGSIVERNIRYGYADENQTSDPGHYLRYDSLLTIMDTVITRSYNIEQETKRIERENSYLKVLKDANGSFLFYDEVIYGFDTIFSQETYRYEYNNGRLVARSVNTFYNYTNSAFLESTEYTYSYPRDNHRIGLRRVTSSLKDYVPYVETIISEYDNFGSIVQTRIFSGSDTTVTPSEVTDREFVGERGERTLIRREIRRYSAQERSLRLESLYEAFGRFEGTPVSVRDVAKRSTVPCSTQTGLDAIRVEAPLGSSLTLVDLTGRTVWSTNIPGGSFKSGEEVLVTAPLPAQGTGLYVLVGRGHNWQCVSKVLR